jgi:DNA-binding PadR family transcriptional regulator
MAREKFQTLTEQMFYILLCLQSECYGMDIMEKIHTMTKERVTVGPGTLYNLLESFVKAGMIRETKVEGRKRSYLITDAGRKALETEYQRLMILAADFQQYVTRTGGISDEDEKT